MGEVVSLANTREIQIHVSGLRKGDVLQIVTAQDNTPLLKSESDGRFDGIYKMNEAGFARIEILREFIPGVPLLPALISNPIYFETA